MGDSDVHATAQAEVGGKPVGVISLLQSYGSQESSSGVRHGSSHLYLLSCHVYSLPSFVSVGLGSTCLACRKL